MNQCRLMPVNGVELCVETFGDRDDPAILLVGGAAAPMDWWDERFCRMLAGDGRLVIRYDHRDTGGSVSYEPGAPGYGFDDLVADAAALLDALKIARVHVAGTSMGGGIAQRLALDHADRVASLTVMSASPGLRPGAMPRRDLPQMDDALQDRFMDPPPAPDGTNRDETIDFILDEQRIFADGGRFDGSWIRGRVTRIVDRTVDIAASLTNHGVIDPGAPYDQRLGEITAPTLVIHGTRDPLFPYGHAEALAREIPDARLLPLDDIGHLTPPPDTWDVVVPALLKHTG
jgi:pimeloyl-ACP methyl ester carboxylesterase